MERPGPASETTSLHLGSAAPETLLERLARSMRRYRTEDREALRRFQTRFFGAQARQLEEARFRWLFVENPWTEEVGPEIWLCEREGILGQQSGIVHRLKLGPGEVRASWAIDLMVDPAWRLRGVGPALSERHARSHQVVIGLGATDQLYPSLLRSGWVDIGPIPNRIRPLRPSELRPWWRRRSMHAWLTRHLVTPLAWSADRWGDVVRLRTEARLEPVATFDERVEDVWQLVAAEHPVLAYRDTAALRWRFDLSPDAPLYRRYVFLSNERPAGYLVLRDGALLGAPVCFLVDYLCPLRLMDALLGLVNHICQERGTGAIVCNALHLRAAPAFTRAGYLSRKWDTRSLLWRTQPDLAHIHPILLDRKNWFVTRADSDWDHSGADPSD